MQSGDEDGNFCLDPLQRSPHSQQPNSASFCCGNIQLQLEVRTSRKFYKGKKERLMKGICVPHLSWLKDTPAQGSACISMHKTPQDPGNCIMSRKILFYFQRLENTDLVYQF